MAIDFVFFSCRSCKLLWVASVSKSEFRTCLGILPHPWGGGSFSTQSALKFLDLLLEGGGYVVGYIAGRGCKSDM